MSRWTSVNENVRPNRRCLIWVRLMRMAVIATLEIHGGKQAWWMSYDPEDPSDYWELADISHWMEIPKGP